jgi:hypothetical protein
MTTTVTKTFVRPNTSVAWYNSVIPYSPIQSIVDDYEVQGKLISAVRTYPDSLTNRVVQVWDSIQSFEAFSAELAVVEYNDLRDTYNSDNSVTFNRVIE